MGLPPNILLASTLDEVVPFQAGLQLNCTGTSTRVLVFCGIASTPRGALYYVARASSYELVARERTGDRYSDRYSAKSSEAKEGVWCDHVVRPADHREVRLTPAFLRPAFAH